MNVEQELAALPSTYASFSDATRLYGLEGEGALAGLQVERWSGEEALSTCYAWTIDALSPRADLPLEAMLGQRVRLRTTLADGSASVRSGLVSEAACLGSDGTLSRYRLVLVPWLWLLTQGRHSRVFQDQTVLEIVEAVFAGYAPQAAWRATADATALLAQVRPRSYCVQYRETDYAFVSRLLAEEGLGYAFEEDAESTAGQRLVIFGDSGELAEDPSSAAGASGLRYHRAGSTEAADTIQAMAPGRQVVPDAVTVLSPDYKSLGSVTASLSLSDASGHREQYEPVGMYAFADSREAEHYARLQVQAWEARQESWSGRGSVRSARAGSRFRLSQAYWTDGGEYVWTNVRHAGINNLPGPLREAARTRLGPGPALPGAEREPALWSQAQALGYAQRFTAVARQRPWRPQLEDDHGLRLNPRPTAPGAQTAIVVGPQGETQAGASGPLYTDALGRLKVRFHWQQDGTSCWVRVAQRYAGEGHGQQFLPRIGQEVLVQFMDGDIDRPVIVGALYHGQGEAGVVPTPGGTAANGTESGSLYGQAADHLASAQGNLAGGNSPAWHGMSAEAEGHRNAAALSGVKTQGWDGEGHNQLVMDDSDNQGRLQLGTSQSATQLNLGHLIHQADNYRGSFRGTGYELRSDAYGAVRGGRGLLVSSYSLSQGEPAGDATGALALLAQQTTLAQHLSEAATTHGTAALASHEGVTKANTSSLDPQAAPLAALRRSLGAQANATDYQAAMPKKAGSGGTAGAEAAGGQAASAGGTADTDVPHSAEALLTLSGRGGLGLMAGQAAHAWAGETLTLGSGQGTTLAVGNQLRVHSGQAIGWLAGAMAPTGGQAGATTSSGSASTAEAGLSLVAGQGPVTVQAQHAPLALRSKHALTLVSTSAQAELSAKQTVHLAVSGGAYLTIEGGNITFGCPGTLTVHAAEKQFVGPARLDPDFTPAGENLAGAHAQGFSD